MNERDDDQRDSAREYDEQCDQQGGYGEQGRYGAQSDQQGWLRGAG